MTSWSGEREGSGNPRSRIDFGPVSDLRAIVILTSSCPADHDCDYDSDASFGLRHVTSIFFATLSTSLAALIPYFLTLTLSWTCSWSDSCSVFSPAPFLS